MIHYGTNVFLGLIDDISLDMLRYWRNDYRIWNFCRQNDLIPKVKHLAWYEKQTGGNSSDKMYGVFSVETKAPLGVCGLTDIDHINRRAEFSLYVAPEYQGRGFGRDSLLTLLAHGFLSLNLNVIWGESFSYNSARELFKKVGMVEDGARRDFYFRNGKYVAAYLYSMKFSEFESSPFRKELSPCSI